MELKNEHLTRQADIISTDKVQALRVLVIGAGAVGGWTTIALSKLGVGEIAVWDHDKVSVENFNNQIYGPGQLGKNKALAIEEIAGSLSIGDGVVGVDMRWMLTAISADIIVCAADCMDVRRQALEAFEVSTKAKLLVESRMGAEYLDLFAVTRRDIDKYRKTLFSNEEAEQVPCTAKSTGYCAMIVGGLVTRQVKAFIMGDYVPWRTMFNLKVMDFDKF